MFTEHEQGKNVNKHFISTISYQLNLGRHRFSAYRKGRPLKKQKYTNILIRDNKCLI